MVLYPTLLNKLTFIYINAVAVTLISTAMRHLYMIFWIYPVMSQHLALYPVLDTVTLGLLRYSVSTYSKRGI